MMLHFTAYIRSAEDKMKMYTCNLLVYLITSLCISVGSHHNVGLHITDMGADALQQDASCWHLAFLIRDDSLLKCRELGALSHR